MRAANTHIHPPHTHTHIHTPLQTHQVEISDKKKNKRARESGMSVRVVGHPFGGGKGIYRSPNGPRFSS